MADVPVETRNDFRRFIVGRVGEGVDVGCQTRGGGCIDAGHMMVDAEL